MGFVSGAGGVSGAASGVGVWERGGKVSVGGVRCGGRGAGQDGDLCVAQDGGFATSLTVAGEAGRGDRP